MNAPRPAAAIPACLLAWLLPGAGHFYLGRRGKGLVFLLAIGALFGLGVSMDARLQVYFGLEDPLAFLRSLAQMAIGLPYLVTRYLASNLLFGLEPGHVDAVMHEYGNTFTEVGGLLNILIILDAHDTAVGRRP